jgi:hypothetical protein
MNVTPEMTKVEQGGTLNHSSATINDRTALYVGILAFGFSCIAVALALDARLDAQRAEREARMLEYYVLEVDAKLIAAGVKTDAESVANRLKKQRGTQ